MKSIHLQVLIVALVANVAAILIVRKLWPVKGTAGDSGS